MNNESETVIKVEDLKAGYGDVVIIDNINFEVKAGEVFIILGGSGCGKSTLLKHMIGLLPPVKGKVFIEGREIVSAVGQERIDILSGIGVMYQNGALFGSMDLMDNICLVLEEFTDLPRDAMEFIAEMRLKIVGLEGNSHKMPSELSGGMRKRAAIARAMALDPKILFLDEPSAGLDPITSSQLDDLIIELSRSLDFTFVIVTHELPSIYKVADRVVMLDKNTKSIIATGKPDELRENSDNAWVRQFFNRESYNQV
ncbi:MAG: ABC transporter ATP-binding protein [Planctomycetota bacterium]|jgi:phospholipid/cholesterol/gamma-HCH transport system ATP-binding protein